MVGLDARAAGFREEMVVSLRRLGVVDEMVLRVMASVPRHRFVERFWAATPATMLTWDHTKAYEVGEDCSDEALGRLYDPMTAVAIREPTEHFAATTSLSAPVIVALMLSEMSLRHGARVLEIGTGSGYNAALISELVGDPALVTTVDIDPALIADAIPRLDRLGYSRIAVFCGDGAEGVPERAPFDRVVATVGCVDISPAWVGQLADDGVLLAPLEHGPMHPRVAVRRSETGLVGRFMGRSGFVRIQGSQASHRVWPGSAPVAAHYRVERLPASLAEAFDPPSSESPRRMSGLWDFATYLGIRDRRAVSGPGLGHHSSLAMIRGGTLAITGPAGGELAERLVAVAYSWVTLGCPGHGRYAMTFAIKDARPVPPDAPGGPWVLDRIDYRQHVTLVSENR